MPCLGLLTHCLFQVLFLSCTVLLICWFFLILCSHHFLYERAMYSGEIPLKNNHYYHHEQILCFFHLILHTLIHIYMCMFVCIHNIYMCVCTCMNVFFVFLNQHYEIMYTSCRNCTFKLFFNVAFKREHSRTH